MSQALLPVELVELQLAQIDLLMAMYPGEGVLSIDETSSAMLDDLRVSNGKSVDAVISNDAPSVSILLNLEVDTGGEALGKTVQLDILVPFTYYDSVASYSSEVPNPKVRLRQPPWMSKAEAAALMVNVPKDEDLFASIEHIREAACYHLSSTSKGDATLERNHDITEALVRVWFYFPSISTRSKRDDLVNYAPTYQLTGFLLSGKPGVLCLEGTSGRVDAYMKFVKTESWGDIPAHQKKVSERFREPVVARVFEDMQEITDTLGERRGERANRGDLKSLEAWLIERGLGEAFMKVLT
jgi:hypothetical protein